MAKIIAKSKVKKVKKKFEIQIMPPKSLGSQSIGISKLTDLKTSIGKRIKFNLMYLTNNMKNQNIRLILKIDKIENFIAQTSVCSYEQIPYYLKRNLKKGTSLIENSNDYETQDKVTINIKPFIITKRKTSIIARNKIRKVIDEFLKSHCKVNDSQQIIFSIINNRLQNEIKNIVKNIATFSTFEIKKILILNEENKK